MKNQIVSLLGLLLLAGCARNSKAYPSEAVGDFSYGPSTEPTSTTDSLTEAAEDNSMPDSYTPDPGQTVVSDCIVSGPDEIIRAALPRSNLKENYEFIRSLNYKNVLVWDYEVYLPRFTDEIKYDGAKKIKAFYEDEAREEKAMIQNFGPGALDDVRMTQEDMTRETPKIYYIYRNYAVQFIEPYLTVKFGSTMYVGGTHGMEGVWCDNFDMRTGELLGLEDVFVDLRGQSALLNRIINQRLDELYDMHDEVDILQWYDKWKNAIDHSFRLTKQGVEILFAPYEIVPYAYGMPEITIPYGKVKSIMKIDLP